eukprot:CAMPEP_0173431728 /NCGR_PEP_ID=MMETSP1357-20121228/9774_1 /TAXON_ID=77926 /ORGANISM="Hemiselmis rufescens, Strain PCC563" /LENGTH=136 /DNA_ID=CAMNT_0014396235 /DNA_START=1080 /DNA_END=1490 /DNA_ORIENTATION=+
MQLCNPFGQLPQAIEIQAIFLQETLFNLAAKVMHIEHAQVGRQAHPLGKGIQRVAAELEGVDLAHVVPLELPFYPRAIEESPVQVHHIPAALVVLLDSRASLAPSRRVHHHQRVATHSRLLPCPLAAQLKSNPSIF